MASVDTLAALEAHPEWIAPRSDRRVFLGEPAAPEATKTTVEPGNSFSPGMRTFGVTWWLRFPETCSFFAPETAPLEALKWHYEEGALPILQCDTTVAGLAVRHTLFQDGSAESLSEAVCGGLRVTNTGDADGGQGEVGHDVAHDIAVQVFLALRSLGPAGGPLHDLTFSRDGRGFRLLQRDLPLLAVDLQPDAIGCGVGDPSPLARRGEVPGPGDVTDPAGWCYGLMRFDVTLAAGASWQVHLDCPQQTYGALQDELPAGAAPRPADYEARVTAHRAWWREKMATIDLEVPDRAFRDAFFAGLGHMATATVGDQARIAPLAYPLPWLRDSVFIVRCFDLAGWHDLARAATEYCARNDFFGGFGAEGDAPGQGIWALVGHYRLRSDADWLAGVYPAIRRKCDWLFRMRRAERPLRIIVDTPVLSFTHAERASGIICLAACDGVIMGAMDNGVAYSTGWVNHWALCGLREAAYAARVLGHTDDAASYDREAEALWQALQAYAEATPPFFSYERTVNSLLWPTRAWEGARARAERGFNAWWQENRGTGEAYRPEPYWLYFEFAQAHNALLFGQRERAWQVVEYRLRYQDLPGLYGWREGRDGVGTENAVYGVTLLNQVRGCQTFDSIAPHGWSQAEMWLLQRAVLIEEYGDGVLLFAGVPAHWLEPGAHIAFRHFPTWYGRASATLEVDAQGRVATIVVTGLVPGTPVYLRLPGVAAIDREVGSGSVTLRVDLTPDRSDREEAPDRQR